MKSKSKQIKKSTIEIPINKMIDIICKLNDIDLDALDSGTITIIQNGSNFEVVVDAWVEEPVNINEKFTV